MRAHLKSAGPETAAAGMRPLGGEEAVLTRWILVVLVAWLMAPRRWSRCVADVPAVPAPTRGGGAIQLSSRISIELKPDAVINVNGGIGNAFLGGPGPETFDGGGAGGGILLEAPTISLAAGTKLLANGGPAAAEGDFEPPVSETTAVSPGGPCSSVSSYRCGNGGDGAAADGPATAGQDVPYTTTANVKFRAAGGGGGLGYVRINTATGTYSKGNDTIESAVLTTGMLKTR